MPADEGTIVRRTAVVNKAIEPFVDVGSLLLIENVPYDEDATHSPEELLNRARDNTQFLFNRIWALEKERVDEAVVVTLPKKLYKLPREKPIPEARAPTKWERFAATKGIVKQKKAKKIFDEATGDWKPTYGYNSGKDNTKDWLIEVPENKDPNVDYFAERVKDKKERKAKNETQRLKNIARQTGEKARNEKKPPIVKENVGLGIDPMEKSKTEIREAVDRAKISTASLGKFQDKIKGEKPNVKKGIKRKFEANIGVMDSEKERNKNILQRLATKKPKLNEERLPAIAGNAEPEEHKKTRERPRMKSQIHRQQFYKGAIKNKRKGGDQRGKAGKAGGKGKSAKGGGKK